MIIQCQVCGDLFEVAEPVSRRGECQKVDIGVLCAECGGENRIMWPQGLALFSRRYQESEDVQGRLRYKATP